MNKPDPSTKSPETLNDESPADPGTTEQPSAKAGVVPKKNIFEVDPGVLKTRDKAIAHLKAGYPDAGAAEMLLFHAAGADTASRRYLELVEASLVCALYRTGANGDANDLRALAQVAKVLGSVLKGLSSRTESTLLTASTIAAQRRLARLQQKGNE